MDYNEVLEKNELVLALSQEQKLVFLKALLFLSKVDGTIDKDEIKYIKKVARKFKIENPERVFALGTEADLLNELQVISERRVAMELIKELCTLGHADSHLTDDEILFIGHVAMSLNIDLQKVEEINNWVIDKLIWLEQGKIIFEDE